MCLCYFDLQGSSCLVAIMVILILTNDWFLVVKLLIIQQIQMKENKSCVMVCRMKKSYVYLFFQPFHCAPYLYIVHIHYCFC